MSQAVRGARPIRTLVSSPIVRAAIETLEGRQLLASVAATTPYQGQQQVALNANVTVRFNEPMLASTLTSTTLQLRDAGGNLLASTITYDDATKTATINPDADLPTTTSYFTLRVVGGPAGVKDSLGGPLTGGALSGNNFEASFTTSKPVFNEQAVFTGLTSPTSVQFATDGRIFVAEKSGLIKVFDSVTDSTPTIVADLRAQVFNYWDRGLLGMVLDPAFTSGRPYLYVLYSADMDLNGNYPKWGTAGTNSDPAATDSTTLITGRLTRLTIANNLMSGTEKVLVHDWQQQFPSHSIGDLQFGPDGYLYASAGDGASYSAVDYGQYGNPLNDPTNEGGALRSQDMLSDGDPTTLDGTVIRIDPDTGAAPSTNPFASSSDANKRRVIASGLRNPFRLAFRPGTSELFIADTGWNHYEEINRISDVADSTVENFGWPAYEGANSQAAYRAGNHALLAPLYANPLLVTMPWFTYSHWDKVVPGSTEKTGGSTPTGLAFYNGHAYSPGYDGALFFADYARMQIYVMYRGTTGAPDPSTRQIFKSLTSGAVHLSVAPDGNLYYVDHKGGRVVRFTYDSPTPPPPPTDGQLTGTVIGTAGSYANNGFTRDKAFDDDVFTFFDAPVANGAWAGLDFGSAKVVRKISFAPRFDWASRLVGGLFQGSNDPTFSSGVTTLHTVTSAPTPGAMTDVNVNAAGASYRYVRFLGANTTAANIAEMAFFDNAETSVSNGDGLKGTYYNNANFTGTTATRIDPVINYYWGEAESPVGGISALTYSARWTGQIEAVEAGTYTLRLTGDDGVRLYVGGQLLIDKWIDQAPTAYTATVSFAANEKKTITVEYYQNAYGGSVSLAWKRPGQSTFAVVPTQQLYSAGPITGNAPVPTITSPATINKWKVGDVINFSGGATDAEDGTLPASALTWAVVLVHANDIDITNTHEHIIQTFSGVSSGSFIAPDHEYPSWLEVRLVAQDSTLQTATVSQRVDPQTSTITLASNVPGTAMLLGDTFAEAPLTRTWLAGSSGTISTPAQVVYNGQTWVFTGWSNGGTRSQEIVAIAANVTLTATYAAAPLSPTALSATADAPKRVNLKWTDNATTEGGFRVQRRPAGADDAAWQTIATAAANAAAFSDTTAVAGTSYDYRVGAFATGSSVTAYSEPIRVTTLQAAPSSFRATVASDGKVSFTWVDNATSETGYRIQRRVPGGTWANAATLAANATSGTDTTSAKNTAYEYRVFADQNALVGAFSATLAVNTTTVGPVTPLAPTGVSATATSTTSITLRWTDAAANEAGYKIERRVSGSSTWSQIASIGANTTSYVSSGLSTKTTYEYRIRSYYGSTNSAYSAIVSARTN